MASPKYTLVTACLVIIGSEVLSGRTRDANLQYLGQRLNQRGIRLTEARVIPDVPDVIVATLNECRAKFDYVFTTGGIGPTHDDITAACVARAFGVALERNAEARRMLRRNYQSDAELTEARLKMTEIPAGASLIENPVSHAPGFRMENVFVFAGIPRIMQAMFEVIVDTLEGGAPVLSKAVTARLPEGILGGPLADIQKRFPDVEIGSYPFSRDGMHGASLVMRGTDAARLEETAAAIRQMVRDLGCEPIDADMA
ncbi:competence/damage-inducible protein A [Shumkonia mesophila]|uniref:competence/damage-inducible protein A n=1 Tax=Shumkonia mesophila TaxID=2838854 RepID=UPI0029344371|nr:molybdopterin-binding protein [Shumkonia mesophila]